MEIAFFPLTPLGDSICQMGQLQELHRLYDPCHITVFAISLIAELFRNYQYADEVVVLEGKIHGPVRFREVPRKHFDLVFNHGYEQSWTEMLRQLDYDKAYGMEEMFRSKAECEELFDRYVTLDYWKNITLKQYQYVPEQMAEVIRLVNPDYRGAMPHLTTASYQCSPLPKTLPGKYVLMQPGTSWIAKYWPIQKYFQLAETLRHHCGLESVFVIGPQDRILIRDLEQSGFMYFDNLSLSQLGYIICRSELTVGNDSGPMHLAACFDVKTIHFFSFTGIENWFSYNQSRHKAVKYSCGRPDCQKCQITCIGKITMKQALEAVQELLELPEIPIRQIAYFAQDLLGDALVNFNLLEKLSQLYAPCKITVFCTKKNHELFLNYAFCDEAFCYMPGAWQKEHLPKHKFNAVFNTRYDMDSLNLISELDQDKCYGYESCEIPETICKKYYTAYLPLKLWDDEKLRWESSVTEQGAALLRLIDPGYHCNQIQLAANTFCHNYTTKVEKILNSKLVILVPGASSRYKHWGNHNYFSLANRLQADGMEIVFLLGPQETDYAADIKRAGYQWVSDLSLAEVAQLMNSPGKTVLVIGNDTGIMHLACALGCPSVTISAASSSFTWFPYLSPKHRLCRAECARPQCAVSCRKINECIAKISVEQVWKEAQICLYNPNNGL